MADSSYRVRLGKDATRQLKRLSKSDRARVRDALVRHAATSSTADGSRGGKSLKQIQGRGDRLFRLRVGELRVMFDLLPDERTLLVLGIVNRRDLERWLRGR